MTAPRNFALGGAIAAVLCVGMLVYNRGSRQAPLEATMTAPRNFALGGAIAAVLCVGMLVYNRGSRQAPLEATMARGMQGSMVFSPRRAFTVPKCLTRSQPRTFAIAEPETSWNQLLDKAGQKETYALAPEEKMQIVRGIYVNRDEIKKHYDSLWEGSKKRKEMTMKLKKLKRFLKYGLLDVPDADVIPADLK
eukprot:CAMPEP_0167815588 /NCGR_PEP_ID=MMETSP0112_2-20121227/3107_1 /TAXON_ID=91324 /ORGANISM="Lotharella globosa, Strain CCCM811" /LENGTH=192 /DNA_ID=CAMNT_0007715027 /DNA_START=26 /DNA_END=604 /DNA_ORIENTATION=+